MNMNNNNEVQRYFNEVSREISTNPLGSEYTPLVVGALCGVLISIFDGSGFGFFCFIYFGLILILRAAQILKIKKAEAKREMMPVTVVDLKRGKKQPMDVLTGMLKGKYLIFMPNYLYKATGIFLFVIAVVVFAEAWYLFLISIYLFNWGRTYMKIAQNIESTPDFDPDHKIKHKKKKEIYHEQIRPVEPPHPVMEDEPVFASTSTKKSASYKEPPKRKPKTTPAGSSRINTYYLEALSAMEQNTVDLMEKKKTIYEFLDEFFGDSEISKNRYTSQIDYAMDFNNHNVEKMRMAVKMFGTSEPTPERREMIEAYLRDSRQLVVNIDNIATALVKADQDSYLKNSDAVDIALQELAETTKYYKQ